ncbi:hypothetical protein EGT29_03705 [Pigmentiphaga sp. H8]|uniref:hypothetical protein n=1 Tax=Pigmentiphaga sp. H8 TaxID=2488560 RepID=UPI000F595A84|nr:hypothetical protein [Pigmentiphaga sp. H8]AZG07042.1 hypothetical protein EGT29_03705 [Pigmentiphaga sp. H8]
MRHSPFTVIYDACVLYPAPLRDFLMWLGLSGRFRARWSREIHEEWKRNLLLNRQDLTRAQLDRTSDLMDRAIPDEFIDNLFDLDAAAVVSAAQRQRAQLVHPSIDVDRYLDILLRQGLVQTAKALATYRGIL